MVLSPPCFCDHLVAFLADAFLLCRQASEDEAVALDVGASLGDVALADLLIGSLGLFPLGNRLENDADGAPIGGRNLRSVLLQAIGNSSVAEIKPLAQLLNIRPQSSVNLVIASV
nr:hypothetical protein [Ensifer adhaerens]